MQRLLNPISMFLSGLFLGTAARLLDIYTQNLGEIFSQMSIWILIGTLIAIYSPTKRSAMCNIIYINPDCNMVVAIVSNFKPTAKDRIEFIRQYVEPAFCEFSGVPL